MEQPCYKCGEMVVEGRPFCPHCVAPQIRVVVAEPLPAPVSSMASGGAQAVGLPATQTVPVLAVPTEWSQAVKPAALAALLGTILVFLRLYPIVAILIAGFLSVLFYRQSRPDVALKTAIGARLGALSGLFSSAFMTLVTGVGALIPEVRENLHRQTIEYFQNAAASQPGNPQLQSLLENLKTPTGFGLLMILLAVLFIGLSIGVGSLGGALGATILGRRGKS